MFTKLEVSNFRSISGTIAFPLTGRGLILLNGEISGVDGVDSNGAGKSSIYRALIYALYDYNFDEPIASVVNNHSQDDCRVVVEWEQNHRTYTVIRSRSSKGRQSVQFLENGNPRGDDKNVKAVNNDIETVLGLARETFMLTLMSDGETTFANISDAQQKAILDGLLSINITEHLPKVKQRKSELMETLNGLTIRKARVDSATYASAENLTHYQQAVEEAHKKLDIVQTTDNRPELHNTLNNLRTEKQQLQQRVAEHAAQFSDKIRQLSDYKAWLESQQYARKVNYDKLQNINEAITKEKADYARATSGDKCTSCNRRHDIQSKEFYYASHKSKHESYMADLQRQHKACTDALAEIYKIVVKQQQVLTEDEWQKADWSRTLGEYTRQLDEAHAASRNVDPAISSRINDIDGFIGQCTASISVYETNLVNAKNVYADAIRAMEAAKERQRKAQEAEGLPEIEKEIEKVSHQMRIMDYVEGAFHKNGLSAFVMSMQLPSIEQIANEYLRVLSPSALSVTLRIRGDDEKYSGNILLTAQNEYGSSSYAGLSKGERERINIALTLALRKVVVDNHFDPGVLFLDELIDGLDQTGIESVIALLQTISDDTQIVCVSHNKAIKALFPDVITVKRAANSTTEIDTSQLVHYAVNA